MSRKPKNRPEPAPDPEIVDPEEDNGVMTTTEVEPVEPDEPADPVEVAEEPAKMKVQIEGTAGAVRAAARKVANAPAPPPKVQEKEDEGPPVDDTEALLADGRNMVVVRRQFPKSVELPDGTKRRCAVKMPEPYACPTTREEIEADVFENFGGRKYKCTIHPATPNGEGTVLGFFTIEHPDSDVPPFIEGVPSQEDVRNSMIPGGTDPTMRETDGLAKIREAAERRVERARVKKEAMELEAEARRLEAELENGGRPPAPAVPSAESEELRKLREENERLRREAEAKKNDDRFGRLEDSIAKMAASITALATAKPSGTGENDLVMKMFTQSQNHSKEMVEALKTALTAKSAPAASADESLDKMLERQLKLKNLFGGGEKKEDSRMSQVADKLMDAALDQLLEGKGGDSEIEDEQDVIKYGLKQLTPVLKTYVEKTLEKEAASGGQVSQEREKQIYAEGARKTAEHLIAEMKRNGINVLVDKEGHLVPVPATPQHRLQQTTPAKVPASRVISERKTAQGNVKTVQVEKHNLQKPAKPQMERVEGGQGQQEEDMPTKAEFPGIGPNGGTLIVDFPAHPGKVQYDRRKNVNFVLDAIRSELATGVPKNGTDETYVPADALELLDDEILTRISKVDTGPEMEAIMLEFGDKAKVDEIKDAGAKDEIVSRWLRRLVITIGDAYLAQQGKPPRANQ